LLQIRCEHYDYYDGQQKDLRINTLRTGDADLRFYITSVRDG